MDFKPNDRVQRDMEETLRMEMPLSVPYGGGTRAGLFRTPVSGGVQSATSAHGLPRPALAVRNLMEQVAFTSSHHLFVNPSVVHNRLLCQFVFLINGLILVSVAFLFELEGQVCPSLHCHVSDASPTGRISMWFLS